MEESNDNLRTRWTNNSIKCFLEACISEVTQVGRKGGSLKKESWIRVKKQLLEVCNISVKQRQMKNQYDYLKGKYMGWVYLKEKSGNRYNPATDSFNLTNQEWEDFFKDHPKARTLRSSPLAFPDLCKALFDGTYVTGANKRTSSSNVPRPCDSPISPSNVQPLMIEGVPRSSQQASQSNTSVPPNGERPSVTTSNFNGQRPQKKSRSSTNISRIERDISNALQLLVQNNTGPSYEECVEKLNSLGWATSSFSYVAALVIFCDSPSYRKGWMSLPKDNDDLLKSWIALVGVKLGFSRTSI